MVLRTFFSFDNDAMLRGGNPATPIINNSDTPNGTIFTFVGGGGHEITLNDTAGGGTSTTVFEDDQTGRHTITNGNGLVANGNSVEAESLIFVRALDVNGNQTGPTITLTVFSRNGVTQDVWGFASNAPLDAGTQYVKTGGNNTGTSSYASFIACFAGGTRIRTPHGRVRVEALRAGDAVWTRADRAARVVWAGRRSVAGTGDFAPIVFAPGTLGNKTELVVSPNHRMWLADWTVELLFGAEAVLVAAKHLLGLAGVARREMAAVDYHHILFDRHAVVDANGALSESFYPGAETLTAADAQTQDELLHLFPDLARNPAAFGPTAARCLTAAEARVFVGWARAGQCIAA